MKHRDIVEETYTALRNAGFVIELDGMSFVVRLTNRVLSTMEVHTVLYRQEIPATLSRVGDSVRVRI